MGEKEDWDKKQEKKFLEGLDYEPRSHFALFLTWLSDYKGFTMNDILYVVEKPWKYKEEGREFWKLKDEDW
tara:strand:+ start:510 stop:722 length:213 start_codon:yes stop_codon:yes gene_type:complete